MNTKPIRLLVVDDSALARKIITTSLAPFREIEIVGTAMDPYAAREKILALNPDVVTLDIEMPRMDGLTFLKVIMKHRPMPVIIMSSLTTAGSQKALEALQAGAVDVMEKPGGAYSAHADGTRLAEKIAAAANARIHVPSGETTFIRRPIVQRAPAVEADAQVVSSRKIILFGASTGGTEALKKVLMSMRGDLPGICIVQHIPANFSKAFADRLNQICPMEVREARDGDVVKPGLALIAPGGFHMLLKWRGNHYKIELSQGPAVHHQRPAVDILFDSAVRAGAGAETVAAVLTGMGADGAAGLLRLRETGARTIAQDEETSVVFGMPREAIRLGAAQQVLPLERIAPRVEQMISETPALARPAHSPAEDQRIPERESTHSAINNIRTSNL
ncbi:MAG TPA: chemotaxis response regulator protein-glutamate methylesterase [Verrucomicrobiae bacterium]|jgi:two-component system chemotaxis response regulator CheB|nr:chemotaxis response regulator protein-glutamate methylesterase [Verrucomicrobiae bacterium]